MAIRMKKSETLRGVGPVTREGEVVTERASYRLTRSLEMHTEPGVFEEVEGLGVITGSIKIPSNLARDLVGERLTLTVEGGRRLDFVIMKPDGTIQVVSGLTPPADAVQP